MQRKLILTSDGSHTIEVPSMNVTYHSVHGAIQESMHVFIHSGFHKATEIFSDDSIRIFEVGFGTGLNALLTLIEAAKLNRTVHYKTIEPFPLDEQQTRSLNYCEQLQRTDLQPVFEQLHLCGWENKVYVSSNFSIQKLPSRLLEFKTSESFHLIYFDAFDPRSQPELWSSEIFQNMFDMLEANGVLVTYSSKGDVRRAMLAAGFKVEKLTGPRGKREILRAYKT